MISQLFVLVNLECYESDKVRLCTNERFRPFVIGVVTPCYQVLIHQVSKAACIIYNDLPRLYINKFFRFEIAQCPDQ